MTSSVLGVDIDSKERVELPKSSRRTGLIVPGLSGTGKTGLFENLIEKDIKQEIGIAYLTPHKDSIGNVISRLPQDRLQDVILFDLTDRRYYYGYNPYECRDPKNNLLLKETLEQIMHIFKVIYGEGDDKQLGILIEQGLRNSAMTLIQNPGTTIYDVSNLFMNERFCKQLVNKLPVTPFNKPIRDYWKAYWDVSSNESRKHHDIIKSAVTNKLEAFTIDPMLSYIFGQKHTTFDMRKIMDSKPKGKILLVQLDSRNLDLTKLVGITLIAQILSAAYSRSDDLEEDKRKQFHVYLDEFSHFQTPDVMRLITQARKFGVCVTIAFQYLHQLTFDMRKAVLAIPNIACFRINGEDAEVFKQHFTAIPEPGEIEYKPIYEPEYETKWEWDSEETAKECAKVEEIRSKIYSLQSWFKMFIEKGEDNIIYSLVALENLKQAGKLVVGSHRQAIPALYSLMHTDKDTEKELKEKILQQVDTSIMDREKQSREEWYELYEKAKAERIKEKDALFKKKYRMIEAEYQRQMDILSEEQKQLTEAWKNRPPEIIFFPYPTGKKTIAEQELEKYPNNYEEVQTILTYLRKPHRLSNGYYYPGIDEVVKTIQYVAIVRTEAYSTLKISVDLEIVHDIPAMWEWHQEMVTQIDTSLKTFDERRKKLYAEHYALVTRQKTIITSDGVSHPVWKPVHGYELKVSQSFSARNSRFANKDELTGYTISEDKIPYASEKRGRDEPYSNAWDRIHNILISLPDFTAMVRIKIPIDEKTVVTHQHIIATEKPSVGVKANVRDMWIEHIKQLAVKSGILCTRTDVEKELIERQEQFRNVPPTPKSEPFDQKPVGKATPARARIVELDEPEKLVCQHCGYGLRPTKKFCGNCGKKVDLGIQKRIVDEQN